MTMALCFNCGATKFGAICPCPHCNVNSTGDMQLDITFSDHHLSTDTLAAFGEVVRAIRAVCADDRLRFWAFIRYVAVNHGAILGVKLPPKEVAECDAVLARADAPAVHVERSEFGRMRNDRNGRGRNGQPDGP
jgi:hypothetical protein